MASAMTLRCGLLVMRIACCGAQLEQCSISSCKAEPRPGDLGFAASSVQAQDHLLLQVQTPSLHIVKQPAELVRRETAGGGDIVVDKDTLLDLGSRAVSRFMTIPGNSTLVSLPRQQATVALAMRAAELPGDFAETGVYNGGTSILMAKVMLHAADKQRKLWSADSFEGLPEEDHAGERAARSQEDVERPPDMMVATAREGAKGEFSTGGRAVFEKNLAASGLGHSKRIKVLQGWFNDTLPLAPIEKLAFLRLDGDIFVSTMDALVALYDKVVPGGYIYVDDYGSFAGCRNAVNKFLRDRKISARLHAIPEGENFEAVWWQKQAPPSVVELGMG